MRPDLIGGEMPLWSDPDPAAGDAFAALLALARGRTLVAGPHAPDLLRLVPDLTVLVRGVADAEDTAARFPAATVHCGDLSKLAAEPFDTVVALAGPDRLTSAEAPDRDLAETLERLAALVSPGGLLLLTAPNGFGLPRLTALPTGAGPADWVATPAADPAEVRAALTGAGLTVAEVWAAYPAAHAPSALLSEALLADPDRRGWVSAALARACRTDEPVLTDPARLAADALRHGLAASLAPGWVIAARRDPAEPAGLAGTANADRTAEAAGTAAGSAAGSVGLPSAVVGGAAVAAIPAGAALGDLLDAARLRHDVPALRDLITAWQASPAADVPADQVLLGPDGTHVALAPPGDKPGAPPGDKPDSNGPGDGPGGALRRLPADPLIVAITGVTPDVPIPLAYDDLAADRDRLAAELAEARAAAQWHAAEAAAKDREIGRLREILEQLSATGPARVGRLVLGGMRAARGSARTVVRKLSPPG